MKEEDDSAKKKSEESFSSVGKVTVDEKKAGAENVASVRGIPAVEARTADPSAVPPAAADASGACSALEAGSVTEGADDGCDAAILSDFEDVGDPDDLAEAEGIPGTPPDGFSLPVDLSGIRPAKHDPKEALTPDRSRKSIANDHPQELKEVLQRDPAVREAVELFQGEVIDIHR